MKKHFIYPLISLSLVSLFAVGHDNGTNLYNTKISTNCRVFDKRAGGKDVLRIYNSEDYILLDEDTNTSPLIEEFEELYNCEVIYECFDTNENMLSKIKLGAANYDLVCTSEYTVQRMVEDNLIIPFDEESTPTYDAYASKFLIDKLASIEVNGKTNVIDTYARGYMWGTLGYLYNPNYVGFNDEIRETIHEDMNNWDSLWSDKYESSFYLKDSIRDTYALGVMHAFKDEFEEQEKLYNDGELTEEEYNKNITEIFNRCDQDSADKVFSALSDLKANGAAFEIDEGKIDMIKGYIGVDLAWSGDAIYAMYEASEQDVTLYYQAPELAANIWFDAWVMPQGANKDLASKFVDFMSDPERAVENSDYIGYISFIAGDALVDYILENYDVTDDDTIPEEDKFERDISYLFEGTLEEYTLDDCVFMIDEEFTSFDASFPKLDQIPHLCIMRDFGQNLPIITAGWEKFRGNSNSLWAYIVFSSVVALGFGALIIVPIKRKVEVKNRKKRRAERSSGN